MTRTATRTWTRTAWIFGLVAFATTLSSACSSDEEAQRRVRKGRRTETDPTTGQAVPDFNDPRVLLKEGLPDPLEGLAKGAIQTDGMCARAGEMVDTNPNFNAVTNAFCKEKKPITSLKELQAAFGLVFTKTDASGTNGSNNNPAFAILANSSSLVSRSVSAINPRTFVFSPPPGQPTKIPGFAITAFVRGEPFVEVAASAPKGDNKISFYLVKFDLDCEASHNCSNADLLTPAIESNWRGVTVYDDEDLKNTLVDCRHCHQTDGPGTNLMLRMQELEDPWTHWFRSDRPGGLTLMQDYFRAHGENEDLGGVPGPLIAKADGRALEDLVKGQGFDKQPNSFNSKVIENEIKASQGGQPEVNTPPGSSPTWDRLFSRAYLGEFIPVPYHDVKVTDPNKLQFATDEYKKFVGGGGNVLPDIRRVFLDDALEAMTMLPKLGASGRDVIVQTCAQCHNGKLDQSLTRAKFDAINLGAMSREEKDIAIQRMLLGSGDRFRMPPATMRSLPDDARNAAIAELKK